MARPRSDLIPSRAGNPPEPRRRTRCRAADACPGFPEARGDPESSRLGRGGCTTPCLASPVPPEQRTRNSTPPKLRLAACPRPAVRSPTPSRPGVGASTHEPSTCPHALCQGVHASRDRYRPRMQDPPGRSAPCARPTKRSQATGCAARARAPNLRLELRRMVEVRLFAPFSAARSSTQETGRGPDTPQVRGRRHQC